MRQWMDVPNLPDSDLERRLHLERYQYAAQVLKDQRVLDCACGMGYGTEMMRQAGVRFVAGKDFDLEAIQEAERRYPSALFLHGDIHFIPDAWDALVSFETLEHLPDPENVIQKLPAGIRTILASAPIIPTVGINQAHQTDFTPDSFRALIGSRFQIVYERIQDGANGKPLYLMLHGVR